MKHELDCQNDPLDANLEKVLPALHEWHQINKHEMSSLKQQVARQDDSLCELHTKLDSGFTEVKEVLNSGKDQMKQELAGSFLQIAKHLVKDTGGTLSASTTLAEIVGPSRMTFEPASDITNTAQDTQASPTSETEVAVEHHLFRMKPKHLTNSSGSSA
jgi:hypothetical protein